MAMSYDEQVNQVLSVQRTCRGLLPEAARARIAELLQAGDLDGARALDAEQRTGCGYDFNKTVVASPFDGKEHHYTCPACGLEGTYRAPIFPVGE